MAAPTASDGPSGSATGVDWATDGFDTRYLSGRAGARHGQGAADHRPDLPGGGYDSTLPEPAKSSPTIRQRPRSRHPDRSRMPRERLPGRP
ncbi:hypothetical protein GCM10018790_47220 [Kitasatospora xanthocidica]|nr:hypothetical protein GCM10018790_47220 [Kitasatospora xanthocidica]